MKKDIFRAFAMSVSLAFCISCGSTTVTPGTGNGDEPGGGGVETPAATYKISGTVTGGGLEGVTVTLSGASVVEQTATTASDGTYSFEGLSAGDYTVTPSKTDTAFNPASTAVTITAADSTTAFDSAAYTTATIDSSASIDGTVGNCEGDGTKTPNLTVLRSGKQADDCDGLGANTLERAYLSFDLGGAGINSDATILSASLSFTQAVTGTPYSSNSLTIDHFNFGASLTGTDWETGDIDGASMTNSSTASSVSVSDLDEEVAVDLAAVRTTTQLRLMFTSDPASGKYITITRPVLTVQYYQFSD